MFDTLKEAISELSIPIALFLPLFTWVERLSAPIVTILSIVIMVLTALVKWQEYNENRARIKRELDESSKDITD